jgi:hypothetical protein
MTDYIVCIPSYKRAELCNEKTLNMLKENNIPAKKIYVYVANQEEYDSSIILSVNFGENKNLRKVELGPLGSCCLYLTA